MASEDALSSDNILHQMVEALPTHADNDPNSDISSSYEAVALFSHACMVAVGFRLLGFAEGKSQESEFAALAPRLSPQWNATFNTFAFLYAHSQSSMQYVVKVDRLGGKAEIRGIGLAEGAEKITRLEITAKDYISVSSLPLRIGKTDDGQEDRSDLRQKLKDVFISPSRIADLAGEFKLHIIQPLIPGLQKAGYEESDSAGQQARNDREDHDRMRRPPTRDPSLPQPAQPHPFHDPLQIPRPDPQPLGDLAPPGFEDEHEILRPLRGLAPLHPSNGRSPFNIGHDDLNPQGLGPYDPLRGSLVGGGNGGFGGTGGGMHPTFDDPLFAGRGGRGSSQGFNPQAPPGARWDDVGPGGAPRRGGPPNPFGGYGHGDFI